MVDARRRGVRPGAADRDGQDRQEDIARDLEGSPALTTGPAPTVYAIGDVHGRDDLLARLHERIALDPEREQAARPLVVHLGDYIDRGRWSAEVLDRIRRGSEAFDTVAPLGNHEAMMLDCLGTEDPEAWEHWLENGGEATLDSLGAPFRRIGPDPAALAEALGEDRIALLRGLPVHHRIDGYLFVHAGIVPGVPLEAQKTKDLLWIRRQFLDSEEDHGFVVVHGHTPTFDYELRPNRIGIDTGRAFPRTLTAVALAPGRPPRFLQASAEA